MPTIPFEQLHQEHREEIYKLILLNVKKPEDAEDLTQEVFLRAYQSYPRFRGDCKPSTWLWHIALNHCKNYYRTRDTRKSINSELYDKTPEEIDNLTIDVRALPPDTYLDKELRSQIEAAMDALPTTLRQSVVLADLQYKSYTEISQITGTNLSTVKARIHRGRLLLRRRLGPYLND